MKNKSYRLCPVGEKAGWWLDSIGFDCSPLTVESYESVVAPFCRTHDDLTSVDVFDSQPGLVERYVYTAWQHMAEKTKSHHWTVMNLFFRYCIDHGHMTSNPMRNIRKPRAPKPLHVRRAYEQEKVAQLIEAQPLLRDRAALGLLRLAIRKEDLRRVQIRDIDFRPEHGELYLNHAKGGERHRLPIVLEDLLADLDAHVRERNLAATFDDAGDEYLLYPKSHRTRAMDPATVHRWFKHCLAQAGLPATIQMHELRHTAADNIWRTTGNIVIAQKLLRHKSPATTAAYLHPDDNDLRAGLTLVQETWRDW